MNNIKNDWKVIRNLITWKGSASPKIHLLSKDNETIINYKKIAIIFNYYFSTIAKKNLNNNFQINHFMNFSNMPTKTLPKTN